VDLKVDKKTDLKVDKRTKLNVEEKIKLDSKPSPKTLDRRVNVDTRVKVNTNAVIKNNAVNNVSRTVSTPNVARNVQPVQKGKKPLQP
jgi:hypothetical protein